MRKTFFRFTKKTVSVFLLMSVMFVLFSFFVTPNINSASAFFRFRWPTPVITITPTPTLSPTPTVITTSPTPTLTPMPSSKCSKTLQSLIDAAPSGSVLTVPACIYRETIIINKPLTLSGQNGSQIRGSDIWTGWTQSGNYWIKGPLPYFYAHGSCSDGSSRCLQPEQVFFDGKALTQVNSNPSSGQFWVDSNRNVVLADNPTQHTVEVTTRTTWATVLSDNVTIRGFTMMHASNDSQSGAISNNGFGNWTLQNNTLSDVHGAVVSADNATGIQILNNTIFNGGQEGIHGTGAKEALIKNNTIYSNNTQGFNSGWEAGGMKLSGFQDSTIDGNTVYSNAGPGIWCDGNCSNMTIRNNTVYSNDNAGIFYEISNGAKIYNNKVWENGWGYTTWGWGAGILSSSSKNVEIYNNVLAWNADGISVISQDRGNDSWNSVTNDYVHNNQIIMSDEPSDTSDKMGLGWLMDFPGVLYNAASNNRGAYNLYWFSKPDGSWCMYQWNGCIQTLSAFNATPGEENGRYMTDYQKNFVLKWNSIPSAPQNH